jgi:SAM-dependent methyltransferase
MLNSFMKTKLIDVVQCPDCQSPLTALEAGALACPACAWQVPAQSLVPLFTAPPSGIVPSDKLERGPQIGTPWRRANWRFLKAQVDRLAEGALILDVGAGRGDFANLFEGRNYLALDVYPYPEVDVVCDLTQVNPFRPESFDAILLMNVMEHVYDTRALLESLAKILKPGGVILVAIPFMVKIHQAPIDYVRYTHYALQRLGQEVDLQAEYLEGYYDPIFFLGEGTGNLRNAVLPGLKGSRRALGRSALAIIEAGASLLGNVVGAGKSLPPEGVRSGAPTGYQIVFRKGAL